MRKRKRCYEKERGPVLLIMCSGAFGLFIQLTFSLTKA